MRAEIGEVTESDVTFELMINSKDLAVEKIEFEFTDDPYDNQANVYEYGPDQRIVAFDKLKPDQEYHYKMRVFLEHGIVRQDWGSVTTRYPLGEIVNLPNSKIEQAFLADDYYGLEEVYNEYLSRKTSLVAYDLGLDSLEGIEQAPNLKVVNVRSNKLTSIDSILKVEGIEHLSLADNKITSIEGIEKLSNIQTLNLAGNIIDDLTPLRGLEKLYRLSLSKETMDLDSSENQKILQELENRNVHIQYKESDDYGFLRLVEAGKDYITLNVTGEETGGGLGLYINGEYLFYGGPIFRSEITLDGLKPDTEYVITYHGFASNNEILFMDQLKIETDTPPESELKLTGIEIQHLPDKLKYKANDLIDLTGLILLAKFNDGSKETIPISEVNISGFDSSKPISSQKVTATYKEYHISFDVQILKEDEPEGT